MKQEIMLKNRVPKSVIEGEGGLGAVKKPRKNYLKGPVKLKKNGERFAQKRNQKWTDNEDDWICAGVRELGKGSWKEILDKYKDHFHESRDRFTIRLRYAWLEKRGHVDEPGVLKDKSLVVDGRRKNGGRRVCQKEIDGRNTNSGHCIKETDMRRYCSIWGSTVICHISLFLCRGNY